ncbi:sensor domain-containing diguanylate cyclase [Falsibacillus pallidus]|uniref:PAS domain S-box-containing protein/diguanylate cyclase (GGDEF)-like protein n=1 Tax=Falsibacillus pallidus TaxID=493781 RepID=A0A370G8D3_9BACI|nr:sensor domain-containing diguanylate cyclase [Falsibacillus pallidus]RDI40041.1 PAS domain S-box-containing protein/diguanylate cyclase (GGDEF)-like protein [Falsibacillus pallidus]
MNVKHDLNYERVLMDGINDIVFIVKVEKSSGQFTYEFLNRKAIEKTKLDEGVIGKSISDVYPEKEAEFLLSHYQKVVSKRKSVVYEDSYYTPDGAKSYSETVLNPLFNSEGEVEQIVGIVKDITKERAADAAMKEYLDRLEESENRFKIIAEHAQDLITLIDRDGIITYVSPSYQNLLGFHDNEYIGKSFLHNIHPECRTKLEEEIRNSVQTKEPCKMQFQQKTQKGDWIWSELNATPVYDERDQFIYMVVLSRDITLQKEYESKLEHFAFHDSLTSLPNRRKFRDCLIEAIAGLREGKGRFAVLLMDIDRFKQINDEYGHDAGDEVIKEFGRRIKRSFSKEDVVARLGGDEFVALLKGVDSAEKATEAADRIQTSLKEPWRLKNCGMAVTSSIGIAISPSTDTTVFTILKNADKALYEAKDAGRNAFRIRIVE